MIIAIEDERIRYDKETFETEDLFQLILKRLEEKGRIYESMIIDEQFVQGNEEEFIRLKKNDIEEIIINSVTEEEYVNRIAHNTAAFLEELAPKVKSLGDNFYRNEDKDLYNNTADLMEILQQLFLSYEEVTHIKENPGQKELIQAYGSSLDNIENGISRLEEAIKEQDTVLIGDTLVFDIAESLEKILKNIKNMHMEVSEC